MTQQQLNLLATVGLTVCWGALALAWLAGAIYYESRAPAERTRAWFVSPTQVVMVAVLVGQGRCWNMVRPHVSHHLA